MIIDRDVPITVDDGNVLRADVFRPDDGKPAPVIMSLGPYGKGVRYKDGYPLQYKWMMKTHPNHLAQSSKEHLVWETVDPELWVGYGYVVIRVDSRGAGRSRKSPRFDLVKKAVLTRKHCNSWKTRHPVSS
jgi:predicted acyl esterase